MIHLPSGGESGCGGGSPSKETRIFLILWAWATFFFFLMLTQQQTQDLPRAAKVLATPLQLPRQQIKLHKHTSATNQTSFSHCKWHILVEENTLFNILQNYYSLPIVSHLHVGCPRLTSTWRAQSYTTVNNSLIFTDNMEHNTSSWGVYHLFKCIKFLAIFRIITAKQIILMLTCKKT